MHYKLFYRPDTELFLIAEPGVQMPDDLEANYVGQSPVEERCYAFARQLRLYAHLRGAPLTFDEVAKAWFVSEFKSVIRVVKT